jgi:SlyX protein
MSDGKLDGIESVLAHHERQIHDLSEMVNAQWKEIEALKRRLEQAQAKIGEMQESAGGAPPANEKPPHY